ncbi:hypothetical protein ASG69_20955 [Rhodococcus sp. Leaf225]|nr:hypothetical protein ASG69_20955 [Rhodococcus sp. Leaf225]KQU47277.1 hypothetical protein ASH03_21915 [Rhodococcus sp. Leaf258]
MAVRQVLTKVGIQFESNEEGAASSMLLQTLSTLASSAGGEPPLPVAPSRAHLDELRGRKGNDLLSAIADQRVVLLKNFTEWSARARLKQARLDAYGIAQRLAGYCVGIDAAAPAIDQVSAIMRDRLLLAEPDPVLPVIQELAQTLRGEVDRSLERMADGLSSVMDQLDDDDSWGHLTIEQRGQLLQLNDLSPEPEPDLRTVSSILLYLSERPLGGWEDRLQALPTRLMAVREAAAKLLEPTAVKFSVPNATLRSEEDVLNYVSSLRDALSAARAEHGSIVV